MIRRLRALPPARLFLVALVVAVALGAVVVSVSALGDIGMLLAAAALVAALAVLAQWLWQARQSTDWDNSFTPTPTARGVDSRIGRLAGDIREVTSGRGSPSPTLHATLDSLATDRLRHHDEAPDALLGRDFAAYLAGPPTTRLTAAQLAAFTTTLEELS